MGRKRTLTKIEKGRKHILPFVQGIFKGKLYISNLNKELKRLSPGKPVYRSCNATVLFNEKDKPFYPVWLLGTIIYMKTSEILERKPMMGAEDFAFYQQAILGYFFFVGMKRMSLKESSNRVIHHSLE